ncbi:ABC transporter substrate-binding protein [Bradyrhizobium quebecense]|uniref:ABC transporter substrate-binding protein n=2 Tax=Bradyrhizobium quebecense TaxID=2748629 RepID=A0ABS3MHD6_9BRAD|nr:ABC transporter substrate-binding protein [Bradyrhizobium quebecense]UGY06138.1 ABC transporter substrate-binding protein [Bradyrhizobium quebecense]
MSAKPSPPIARSAMRCIALIVGLFLVSGSCRADQSKSINELKVFHAPASPTATLLIHGTADILAMGPVIEGFQKEHPDIEVQYRLYETVPLYQEGASAPSDRPIADLMISSAMDLQVKLANDGHVQRAAIATRGLPDWAVWRDEIFGFTVEPAVIVYNKDMLDRDEVPKSHQDLIRLLERSPERFRRKIATYDIGVSGVGYLFATTESMLSANFWRLAHALGTTKAKLFCCTQDMLDSLSRGDTLIAYDVLGSYALRQAERHPNLGIVVPEDYVTVVSRTIVIPRRAQHPALAGTFVDYVLSEPGQAVVANGFGLSIAGVGTDREQMKTRYVAEKPGLLNFPTLGLPALAYLDLVKREQFVKTWRQIVSP